VNIAAMQYDVITLDTNVFDRNGRDLEGGLLAQLKQFKNGSAQFVLSEIILREVHRHITEKTKNTKDELDKVARKVAELGLLAHDASEQLLELANSASAPEDAAKERIAKFIADTGAEIIPADTTDIKALVRNYFKSEPPFEAAGKKKNEFPDAIALLSLEAWAQSNKKRVLAISHDGGWEDFAENSEWLDFDDDLPSALSKFQEHAEVVLRFVSKLVGDIDSGVLPGLLDEITSSIGYQVSDAYVYPEASADYYYEPDETELTFEKLSFVRIGKGFDIDIVQIGKDRIAARVGLEISANAVTSFSFATKDWVDKDYVRIGGCTADTDIEFEAAMLITIEGDFYAEDEPGFEITEVELIEMIDRVDFGEVGPDFGEGY